MTAMFKGMKLLGLFTLVLAVDVIR